MNSLPRFNARGARRGQSMVEIGLIILLIVAIAIGAVSALGASIANPFADVASAVGSSGASGGAGSDPSPTPEPDYPMPTIVSLGTTSVGSSGSANMPAGIAAGDLALWHMAYGEDYVTAGPPIIAGWELLYHDSAASGSHGSGVAIYYRFLDGTETGTQAASWHGEVDLTRISVFRGVSAEHPFEGGAVASAPNGARSLPSMTTTGNNRLGVCFGAQVQGPSTAFAGETGGDWVAAYEQGDGDATDMRFNAHTAELPFPTTIEGATSATTSYPWVQRCFALVPGVGAASGTPDHPFLRVAGAASTGSSGNAVMPNGVENGDLAIWYMGYNAGSSHTVAAPPAVEDWTQLSFDQFTDNSSHTVSMVLYYRWLDGTEDGEAQTVNWSGNAQVSWIDVYAGVDQFDPFVTGDVASGEGMRTIPAITTTRPNSLALAYGIATTGDDSRFSWQFLRRTSESSGSDSQGEAWALVLPTPTTIEAVTSPGPGHPFLFRNFALNAPAD